MNTNVIRISNLDPKNPSHRTSRQMVQGINSALETLAMGPVDGSIDILPNLTVWNLISREGTTEHLNDISSTWLECFEKCIRYNIVPQDMNISLLSVNGFRVSLPYHNYCLSITLVLNS